MADEKNIGNMLFTGYFERNLDDKGRLSIPARLRSQLEKAQSKDEVVYVFYSTVYKVIRIYTYDGWMSFVQPKIDEIENPDDRMRMMKVLYRFVEDQKLDAQGRIPINKKLAALLGIGKNVSICGMGRGIEVAALETKEESFELESDEIDFLKSIMY